MKRLRIGGGKNQPLNIQERKHARARGNHLIYCALSLLFLAALVGCTDTDKKPEILEPRMTRADSVAAGLIIAVPTADPEWADSINVNFDDPDTATLTVGGTDTDLDEHWAD